MSVRIVAAALVLVLPAVAIAQESPDTKVTSDELVCQLAGDCGQPTADPPTRSFSIRRQDPPSRSTPQSVSTAQGSPGYTAARQRTDRPGSGFAVAPYPVGRASLSVNFLSGSATLSQGGIAQAREFMRALQAPKLMGKRFLIAGHTDAAGSRALNLSLSRRRAEAFVDYLVAQGAARAQFEVKGYGSDRPLPGVARGAAANRRVEVVVLK